MLLKRTVPKIKENSRFSLNREIKLSDFFTATTILISLTSILISWSVDRKMRLTRDANEIRAAAAIAFGDLERWNDLSLSLYAEAQSVFVDASETASKGSAGTKKTRQERVENARDLLWKRLNEIHTSLMLKVVDEKIDSGYTNLFTYYPDVRKRYQETLAQLRQEDTSMVSELLTRTELTIMYYADTDQKFHSSDIGNELRNTANQIEVKYQKRYRAKLKSTEDYLTEKIEADDAHLLRR